MGQQRIDILQEFDIPVERVFAYLAEHENLEKVFAPARIRRLSNGQSARNGVGSSRELRILIGPPFVETVTAYQENELIEYRVTRGSPIKNHCGVMRFQRTPRGTQLHYTVEFDGKFPLVGELIKPGLEMAMRRGLKRLRC
jgi:uncharacterized protein YndB with AHSA1/START domain